MDDIKNSKILIVDDEHELLRMVNGMLRKEGFSRIYQAANYTEALSLFHAMNPDIAILDVCLPDGDGFSLLTQMRETSKMPVLFLSARGEDEDRILGLGLGADDYLVKPFLPKELILRLCAILKRVYLPQEKTEQKPIFSLGNSIINLETGTIQKKNIKEEIPITAKEYILIEKLYENKGKIVTSDSLCMAAWQDSVYGYENTLMVHIRRIRKKIEPDPSSPQYLLTVRGLGYKLMVGE